MTATHPTTALCIWAFDNGFTIIGIKHILKSEFNIRGRRVTDAVSKSLGPRQSKLNLKSYEYNHAISIVERLISLDDLLTFFDAEQFDYWTIKQLLKQSIIWEHHDSQLIWRRLQRLQRREQRRSLKNWSDRSLTDYVRLNNIFTP